MLIAHHNQVPVLVRANPAIKALIVLGDALVSCIIISVGGMYILMILWGKLFHEPHAPGRIGEVKTV